jgi:hypothetical protein
MASGESLNHFPEKSESGLFFPIGFAFVAVFLGWNRTFYRKITATHVAQEI